MSFSDILVMTFYGWMYALSPLKTKGSIFFFPTEVLLNLLV